MDWVAFRVQNGNCDDYGLPAPNTVRIPFYSQLAYVPRSIFGIEYTKYSFSTFPLLFIHLFFNASCPLFLSHSSVAFSLFASSMKFKNKNAHTNELLRLSQIHCYFFYFTFRFWRLSKLFYD